MQMEWKGEAGENTGAHCLAHFKAKPSCSGVAAPDRRLLHECQHWKTSRRGDRNPGARAGTQRGLAECRAGASYVLFFVFKEEKELRDFFFYPLQTNLWDQFPSGQIYLSPTDHVGPK